MPHEIPEIDSPDFATAVSYIDRGDALTLEAFLEEHPELLTATASIDSSFAGEYFASPRLLWFVAENPIRNGNLPDNVADVISVLATAAKRHAAEDLAEVLNYTLGLVTSGRIARESGRQEIMVNALTAAGADPNSGLYSGLAHRETQACELLLKCGAGLTLPIAAGLGREEDTVRLKKTASPKVRQEALVMAAINGQHRCTRIMADSGTDLNAFNPDGLHAHSTPLHQAVYSGSVSTVCALVTRGADPTIRDRIFGGDSMGWAIEAGHSEIVEFLQDAEVMMKAVSAIRTGDVEGLRSWIQENGSRINDTLGDNPRTLLHYATDWPGFLPHVAESISTLAAAGAELNSAYSGPATEAQETPLHWAASSDDLDAATALIEAGAELDPVGGCIENGTPLTLAVIFQNWRVAEKLVESGALISLPLVSGMGRMDLVRTFFSDGEFANPHPALPHADTISTAESQLNGAVCLAAMAGRYEVLGFLLDHGGPVNATSPVETTALDEAINNGHDRVAELLRSRGSVRHVDLGNG